MKAKIELVQWNSECNQRWLIEVDSAIYAVDFGPDGHALTAWKRHPAGRWIQVLEKERFIPIFAAVIGLQSLAMDPV